MKRYFDYLDDLLEIGIAKLSLFPDYIMHFGVSSSEAYDIVTSWKESKSRQDKVTIRLCFEITPTLQSRIDKMVSQYNLVHQPGIDRSEIIQTLLEIGLAHGTKNMRDD